MATPFLFTLPSTARLAYPFILSGVRSGLSSRVIEQAIRGAGLSISRSRSILPTMRKLKALEASGVTIRNINKGLTINVNRLPQALTHLRRDFSYNVRIRGVDAFGNVVDRFVTVATDSDRLSPGEIEGVAEDMVSAQGQSATVLTVTATLESGLRRSNVLLGA